MIKGLYIEELKHRTNQKEQTEIGRELLLNGIRMEYGLSELPEIARGEHGKPYFPAYPAIHFNISHCDEAVVCILSDEPVGIDVESIRPFDRDLAEYVSNKEEYEQLIESEDPSLEFAILWTRKESYCKLTGRGLDSRKEIQEMLTENFADFKTLINAERGFVMTYCRERSLRKNGDR